MLTAACVCGCVCVYVCVGGCVCVCVCVCVFNGPRSCPSKKVMVKRKVEMAIENRVVGERRQGWL